MMITLSYSLIFFCSTLVFGVLLIKIAPRLGLIDPPQANSRKKHTGHPALIGGIMVVLSMSFASVLLSFNTALDIPTLMPALMGAIAYLIIGSTDDVKNTPALLKLGLQILIAGIIVFAFNVKLRQLGFILTEDSLFWLGSTASIFTLLCLIVYINAFNFIDGLDGLSGGIALSSSIALSFIAYSIGAQTIGIVANLLCLATLAFLVFNLRLKPLQKTISFLGDGGSLSLSFILGYLCISLANMYPTMITEAPAPIVYAFLLAYPIFDMIVVMIKRAKNGSAIYTADTTHLHHLLQKHFSKHHTALFLNLLSISYAGLGIIIWQFNIATLPAAAVWLIALFCHSGIHMLCLKKEPRSKT